VIKIKKILIIVLSILILGCTAVKEDPLVETELIPCSEEIWVEKADANTRVYHFKEAGGTALTLMSMNVFQINGVVLCQPVAYKLVVVRSPLFSWDDIECEIIRIIQNEMGKRDSTIN